MPSYRRSEKNRRGPDRSDRPARSTRPAAPEAAVASLDRGWPMFLLQLAILCVAVLWIYSPVYDAGKIWLSVPKSPYQVKPQHAVDWLWDDDQLLTANWTVQHRDGKDPRAPPDHVSTLKKLWYPFWQEGADYFPLSYAALWAQWFVFTMDPWTGGPSQPEVWTQRLAKFEDLPVAWPVGYHLTSVLLHLAGALTLWRLLAIMRLPGAWLAALLFAVHPVCVESVAWVSELKNTLSLPLFLLAAINFVKFDDAPGDAPGKWLRFGLSVVFFLLAMLAKTSMVMFPFVILLYGWWKRRFTIDVRGLVVLALVGASLAITAIPAYQRIKACIRDVGFASGQPDWNWWEPLKACILVALPGLVASIAVVVLAKRWRQTESDSSFDRHTSLEWYALCMTPFLWISLGLGLSTYYYQTSKAIGNETIVVPPWLGTGVANYRDGSVTVTARTVSISDADGNEIYTGPLQEEGSVTTKGDIDDVPQPWRDRVTKMGKWRRTKSFPAESVYPEGTIEILAGTVKIYGADGKKMYEGRLKEEGGKAIQEDLDKVPESWRKRVANMSEWRRIKDFAADDFFPEGSVKIFDLPKNRTVSICDIAGRRVYRAPLLDDEDFDEVPVDWQARVRAVARGYGWPSLKGWLSRQAIAGTSLLFYMAITFWPVRLMPIYKRWDIDRLDVGSAAEFGEMLFYLLPIPVILGALWLCWRYRATWGRHALFAFGFFLIMVFPVLGFTDISYMRITWACDHFIYLPLVGIVALVAAGLATWYERADVEERRLIAPGTLLGIVALSFLSFRYAACWVNEDALWTHTITGHGDPCQRFCGCWQAHNRLGAKKFSRNHVMNVRRNGRDPELLDPTTRVKMQGAYHHFTRSTDQRPDLGETHNNLATAYSAQALSAIQQFDQESAQKFMSLAIEQFAEACRVTPHVPAIHVNHAKSLMQVGRFEEAERKYREMLTRDPDNMGLYGCIVEVLEAAKRVDDAAAVREQLVAKLEELLAKKPNDAALINQYGVALFQTGKREESFKQFQKALEIKPDFKDAKESLAMALLFSGRFEDAAKTFSELLEKEPYDVTLLTRYGTALYKIGKKDQAIVQFRRALSVDPELKDAKEGLAAALGLIPDPATPQP